MATAAAISKTAKNQSSTAIAFRGPNIGVAVAALAASESDGGERAAAVAAVAFAGCGCAGGAATAAGAGARPSSRRSDASSSRAAGAATAAPEPASIWIARRPAPRIACAAAAALVPLSESESDHATMPVKSWISARRKFGLKSRARSVGTRQSMGGSSAGGSGGSTGCTKPSCSGVTGTGSRQLSCGCVLSVGGQVQAWEQATMASIAPRSSGLGAQQARVLRRTAARSGRPEQRGRHLPTRDRAL